MKTSSPTFPLVSALGSTHSAADRSALFVGFPATMAEFRLLAPVHHRLRLLTFRCGPSLSLDTDGQSRDPSFRRDPFARDVLLDPGGTAMPRMTALHMLRSTISNRCVRFVFGVTAASRNTRFQATR